MKHFHRTCDIINYYLIKDFMATEQLHAAKEFFTGQQINEQEQVACAKCGNLTNVRFSAWFDKYNDPFKKGGAYVHYNCLSTERVAELEMLSGVVT